MERYEEALDEAVLSCLETDEPNKASLADFFDAVTAWVSSDEHRGCMVLNLAAESSVGQAKAKAYRARLRRLMGRAVQSFTADEKVAASRTELLISTTLGLNVTAKSGASIAELRRIRNAVKSQVLAW